MEQQQHFRDLFIKWLDRQTTDAEADELMKQLTRADLQKELLLLMNLAWNHEDKEDIIVRMSKSGIADNIFNSSDTATPVVTRAIHRIHFLKTSWFRYAAVIILMLGAAGYLWFSNITTHPINQKNPLNHSSDILAGSNKAILTLSDGRTIILENKDNGKTVSELGRNRPRPVPTGNNIITTPKGGQYQIVLPDGSKVWLNAASSIKFPTTFTGNIRNVEVTGEAYMEIEKNPKQPFSVNVNGVKVEVLGTSFNINAYEDEGAVKATLISGSVRVINNKNEAILKPSQQAIINAIKENPGNPKIRLIPVQTINTDQVLAWKNGIFDFDGENLKSVMRQLERWYDINVQYQGSATNIKFRGAMYKNVALSVVLEKLNEMGVQTRLEGKNLIVF